MRTFIAALTITLFATPLLAAGPRTFGKPLAGLEPTSLAKVLDAPEAGKVVRVEGKTTGVCQNKGCWLELEQDGKQVHVTFEGYSFFVDKDLAGKKVAIEGKVVVQDADPATVEHLKGEGASDAAAAKVTIEATGVQVLD